MPLLRFLFLTMALAILPTAQAGAAEKLTVVLDWFVNPDHAPLVVAKELGLFTKAGLDVELVPPADPSAGPRMVAAGQADVVVHYQPNLYLDVAAGLPLVRFGTLVETPLNSLISLKSGPVKSISDLKGKKIGYSVSGFEDALLGKMLASAGLSKKDVELINVNFSLSPSLIAGQVDAVVGGFRNFELTQMRLEGHEGRVFFPEENGVPAYDELIFVTSKDKISDNRLPRFMDAIEQAAIHITNYPEESWALFIKAYPDLNNELNRQAFMDTLPRFAKRPAALDRKRYERFGAFMVEQGLIKVAPPVSDYAIELQ